MRGVPAASRCYLLLEDRGHQEEFSRLARRDAVKRLYETFIALLIEQSDRIPSVEPEFFFNDFELLVPCSSVVHSIVECTSNMLNLIVHFAPPK